jgi:hypothetical protein
MPSGIQISELLLHEALTGPSLAWMRGSRFVKCGSLRELVTGCAGSSRGASLSAGSGDRQ